MGTKPFIGLKQLLVFFCIGAVVGGCSSAKIAINVTTLPDNPLTDPVQTIALINAVNVNIAQTNQFVNGTVVASFNGSTNYLVQRSFLKMESIFNNGQYFQAFDTAFSFLPKTGTFRSNTLPVALMIKACRAAKVDAIITIEGYTADIDSDSEVRYSTPVDRTYGTIRVPYFDGEQSVFMKMLFRAYSCKSYEGELDFQTLASTQVSRSTTGSSPYEVSHNMQNAGSILVEAAENIAVDFANHIGPQSSSISRKIYTKGNDQMAQAYGLAGLGDWNGANNIWYLLATSNNLTIAARATYNLILGNEVLMNFKEAYELAEICKDKYGMKKIDDYVSVLKEREGEIAELRRLFPSILL